MSKIEKTILVKASTEKNFQESLDQAVETLQTSNLEVEINHSMCQAQKGVGYMYSAVVTGRQA